MASLAGERRFSEVQVKTRAKPTTATTGLELGGLSGVRVSICTDLATNVLDGGYLRAWRKTAVGTVRIERNGELDIDFNGRAGLPVKNEPCLVFPDQPIDVQLGGQLIYATDTVHTGATDGGDGGATVTVYLEGAGP